MATTAEPTTTSNQPVEVKTPLTIHVVLDRSGSMESVRDDAIGAYNAYIDQVAKDVPGSTISLTLFDTQAVETIYVNEPIEKAPKLTRETYVPRASTPLYDAVGRVISVLAGATAERKALVILTDGHENSSREFTKERIKALIDEKEEKEGWLVIYLGANQDAFDEGGKFGAKAATTMSYDVSNLVETMGAVSAAVARYSNASSASEGRLRAAFTSDERKRAKKDEDGGTAV